MRMSARGALLPGRIRRGVVVCAGEHGTDPVGAGARSGLAAGVVGLLGGVGAHQVVEGVPAGDVLSGQVCAGPARAAGRGLGAGRGASYRGLLLITSHARGSTTRPEARLNLMPFHAPRWHNVPRSRVPSGQ